MIAAHHKTAVLRIADDNFARLSAFVKEWGFAAAHWKLFGLRNGGIRRLPGLLDLHVGLKHGAIETKPFEVSKNGDVEHERKQQHRETGRGVFDKFEAQWAAADFFDDCHQDVAAVEHGDRQQIDEREIDVEQHEEVQREAVVAVH